jgi:hypothetical protein
MTKLISFVQNVNLFIFNGVSSFWSPTFPLFLLELAEEQQTKTRTGADVNDVRKIMISVAKHMIILVIIRSLHTFAQGLTNCSKAF